MVTATDCDRCTCENFCDQPQGDDGLRAHMHMAEQSSKLSLQHMQVHWVNAIMLVYI